MNKVILIGHLGAKPELKFTTGGTAVVNVGLATNSKWTNKNGEQKEKIEWHRLLFIGKRAETLVNYQNKGSHLSIEGELQTRKWMDKKKIDHWTTEILVQSMYFLSKKSEATTEIKSQPQLQEVPIDVSDDDIPF